MYEYLPYFGNTGSPTEPEGPYMYIGYIWLIMTSCEQSILLDRKAIKWRPSEVKNTNCSLTNSDCCALSATPLALPHVEFTYSDETLQRAMMMYRLPEILGHLLYFNLDT